MQILSWIKCSCTAISRHSFCVFSVKWLPWGFGKAINFLFNIFWRKIWWNVKKCRPTVRGDGSVKTKGGILRSGFTFIYRTYSIQTGVRLQVFSWPSVQCRWQLEEKNTRGCWRRVCVCMCVCTSCRHLKTYCTCLFSMLSLEGGVASLVIKFLTHTHTHTHTDTQTLIYRSKFFLHPECIIKITHPFPRGGSPVCVSRVAVSTKTLQHVWPFLTVGTETPQHYYQISNSSTGEKNTKSFCRLIITLFFL